MTREEYEQAKKDDINPMKYAGEGWFATEEYAKKGDIEDKYVRGEMGKEEDYYPGPDKKKRNRRDYMK